jgi:hypothetical protein
LTKKFIQSLEKEYAKKGKFLSCCYVKWNNCLWCVIDISLQDLSVAKAVAGETENKISEGVPISANRDFAGATTLFPIITNTWNLQAQ